jgi:hypothetical protein
MQIVDLLSDQAQEIIARGIIDEFKALRVLAERSAQKGDYVKQCELAKEMGISVPTLKKFEIYGLNPISLGDSHLVFYSRNQLDEVMRSHMI